MTDRLPGGAGALLALLMSLPAAAQERGATPLSRSYGASPLAGSAQAPALWYYGPSYSLHYDRPPAGAATTGPSYRSAPRFDPFYGPDQLERSERGLRFGR